MEAIIETKHLTHTYSAGTPFERSALLDVDFSTYKGSTWASSATPARENPPSFSTSTAC